MRRLSKGRNYSKQMWFIHQLMCLLSGILSEKQSADLYTLDVKGDDAIAKRLPTRFRRLKADDVIAQRSAVPAVPSRKRTGDKTTDGIVAVKRQRSEYVTHKELRRLRKVADGHHATTVEVTDATYDPWDESVEAGGLGEQSEQSENIWLPPSKPAKAPRTMKHQPISLSANGKVVAPVAKLGGGYSYNPLFAEYEERLKEEGMKAVEAERQRLREVEKEQALLEAAARSAAEAEAAEARAELSEWDEDSAWEGFESGVEDAPKASKRPERKTQAQRNRIKRRKEEERRAKHDSLMKVKRAQAERIKQIAKEVAAKEQALTLAQEELSDSSEEGDEDKLRKKQLGNFRLPEKDLELVLPDELQDSLRLLKPEGNLLKDRYRSLVVRGKLEGRRRIAYRKQPKVKMTEKWTHKDFLLW
jgi:nucleolar protein 53